MQNLIKFHRFTIVHKIFKRILTLTKGHNCIINLRTWTLNTCNLDLVKVNAYAKFDQIPSIHNRSQDTVAKL